MKKIILLLATVVAFTGCATTAPYNYPILEDREQGAWQGAELGEAYDRLHGNSGGRGYIVGRIIGGIAGQQAENRRIHQVATGQRRYVNYPDNIMSSQQFERAVNQSLGQ